MLKIKASLFENIRLYKNTGEALDLGSPTTRSLIAYLLLNRNRPIDRRKLAFIFWSQASESAARRNLRQYLHQIRAALAPIDPEGNLLKTDRSDIQFNPMVVFDLDVDQFVYASREGASNAEIEYGLTLYTGGLLEDIYDDWCSSEREHIRRLWLNNLNRYSQFLLKEKRFDEALTILQKWIVAEPFDEIALCRLMQVYTQMGDRTRSIQAYFSFAEVLREELGAEPLPETQALLQAIQSGNSLTPLEKLNLPSTDTHSSRQTAPVISASPKPPFIGRQNELATLETIFLQALKGSGRLMLISGESGIGKTRLLEEYLSLHPNINYLFASCYELDSLIPFSPFRQALNNSSILFDLLHNLDRKSPPHWITPLQLILPNLETIFPDIKSLEGSQENKDLRNALLNLILYLSESCSVKPLHLILDNLQWADASTWELLATLARRAVTTPILIFGLFCVEDLPVERLQLLQTIQRSKLVFLLDLPHLTQVETTDLTRFLNPAEAKNQIFIKNLYSETDGNPFFIIETLNAMQENGSNNQSARMSDSLPHSIQRVIQARLDRLSQPSREALASSAAFGRTFTYPLLRDILQATNEDVIGFIEEWHQRGLVIEGESGYDFRHSKFRQVAYASLSRARREFIHGKIAAILENSLPPTDVTSLAYHYTRSDQPIKALPFLIQAGEQALRFRSYHVAHQFGLQAVNLLGHMPGPRQRSERIDINIQLAQAYAFTGNFKRAIEMLNETENMAVVLGDEQRLGQIFRKASQFFWLRGQPETASDYARRSLRVAEELTDTNLLYASLRMLGRVSIALAAFDDAIAQLLRYINLYDDITISDLPTQLPEDMPIVLGYLGVAYSRVGAWSRAIETAQQGLEIAKRQDGENLRSTSIFASMQLAMVYAGLKKWQECLNILTFLPDDFSYDEITPPTYMAISLRGYAQANLGQTLQGIQTIRNAIDWAERVDHRVFQYLPRLFLAESLLLDGKIQDAEGVVQQALRESSISGNRWATGIGKKILADIHTRESSPDWQEIENDLIESMQLLRQVRARPDLARTYLSLRRLYDRAGQIAWAVDCHFRATTIFNELEMVEEMRLAQGQAAGERLGAVVIPNLPLRGPNIVINTSDTPTK